MSRGNYPWMTVQISSVCAEFTPGRKNVKEPVWLAGPFVSHLLLSHQPLCFFYCIAGNKTSCVLLHPAAWTWNSSLTTLSSTEIWADPKNINKKRTLKGQSVVTEIILVVVDWEKLNIQQIKKQHWRLKPGLRVLSTIQRKQNIQHQKAFACLTDSDFLCVLIVWTDLLLNILSETVKW